MKTFTFNGEKSSDYGLYISGLDTYNSAEKDIETQEIPGRSGDLLVSNHRYKNVTIPYKAYIRKNFKANTDALRAWLLSTEGYCRLEDDYHSDQYRLAYFKGPLEFDVLLNRYGECTIEFEAMPQRFLKSGEESITLTASSTITNPTRFSSSPLIRVYGGGVLSVGSVSMDVTAGDEYIDIDCDSMDAYEGAQNRNSNIPYLSSFPSLAPGETTVTLGNGITKVIITPRWFTL